ncbi:MAG: c-type cytochrome [Balneolaceae bacterium]|nr:c-type cytochrome [Balneolaceae bacterium]
MKLSRTNISLLLLSGIFLLSCRGHISENPPVHPNPNMDYQERYNAQETNTFFDDNRAMRQPVEGTIARGQLRLDDAYYEGLDENGELVEEIPVEVTREFIYRGKERYDIYCRVCHGGTGDGRGIIMTGQYGYVPAPSFHTENIRQMPDGHFYSAITNGIRTMPSYATQIKVEDRWAIVAYIRALQRSQNVPESEMERFDVDLAELQQEYQEEQERLAALEEARSAGASDEVSSDRGEQLYVQNACQTCHSTDGTVLVGPSFQGLFGSERTFEDGSTATADEEYIAQSIREPSARVVQGFQNAMVPYDYLSESEVQSLIEFIKTLSEQSETEE